MEESARFELLWQRCAYDEIARILPPDELAHEINTGELFIKQGRDDEVIAYLAHFNFRLNHEGRFVHKT